MSKQTQQFFEQIKSGEQPTLVESVKEAAASAKEVGGQMWDSMKPMFDHGRTELAAALFSGHAHVMYMKGQEGAGQALEQGLGKESGPGGPGGQAVEQDQSRESPRA